MKKFLLTTSMLLAPFTSAYADVVLDTKLSGTGDNVIFESLVGNIATGSFNGQHTGIVRFTDLSGNLTFTGAQNGNDIKISNTSDLQIQVFNTPGTTVLPTTEDVFSLKGTGSITALVSALDPLGNPEPIKTFNLGPIDPNSQSGFTFTAINGEAISKYSLVDAGGVISDFEHYRIDVSAPVPGPVLGSSLPGLAFAAMGMVWLARGRQRRQAA